MKGSLFSKNNISVLIAKARQIVGHFNRSSTACEKLKNIQVTLGSSDSMQKALLFVQDVETMLEFNIPYAEKTRETKIKCPELCG